MSDNTTLIISGVNLNLTFANRYLRNHTFTRIISVDNGLSYVQQLGITPDIIIGDFDTAKKELVDDYKKKSEISYCQLNPEKDATDTEAAIDLAIQYGSLKVVILGAMGGRFDHTLGNLQMLYKLKQHNIKGYLLDEQNKIYVITHGIEIHKEKQSGKYISLLPFTESVSGLTLIGFKYPLKQYDLCCGTSIGVSNEIIDEVGKISFDSGVLVVIESND